MNQTNTSPQPIPFQLVFPQQNTLQTNANYKTNTPFITHNPTQKLIHQKYRGGKYRGGKRDSTPRR
jgi:hypothetical protein